MIDEITFEDIFQIWNEKLWPGRQSKIETNSAMIFLGGYTMENMLTKATFFAYIHNGQIIGVNSGHLCSDNSYRSRGVYVDPEHRKKGIGVQLLMKTIEQGEKEGADFIWSYPKKSSWTTYQTAGFTLASEWEQSELDTNAYCKKICHR